MTANRMLLFSPSIDLPGLTFEHVSAMSAGVELLDQALFLETDACRRVGRAGRFLSPKYELLRMAVHGGPTPRARQVPRVLLRLSQTSSTPSRPARNTVAIQTSSLTNLSTLRTYESSRI